MHKKPFNKDEEEERREQADTYEEEEDGQEIFNSMQRPQIWSGRQQILRRLLTTRNSVASGPAQASGASYANAEAARRSQTQAHLSNSQQSQVPGPIPQINAHAVNQSFPITRGFSRNGAPKIYFSNRALGSQVQSQNAPMFRGPRPREGNFPTTQQPLTKKHTEEPPATANQVPNPRFNYASSATTFARNDPTQRCQRYYCVLCEYYGVYSTSSFSWHCNRYHRYGHKMKCYARAVFEEKVIFAPKDAVENNELASCSNCQKVLFKHRAKLGNHDCIQYTNNPQIINYMTTIDEGEGDEYCLMCQLRCENVEEHHKNVHNGNTVYKVGEMFEKKCLAPLHLHDEDHRDDELMEDIADGGQHRFAYEYRARRITSSEYLGYLSVIDDLKIL